MPSLPPSDIAGALRGQPVEFSQCVSIDERAIANAEYVIEGEIVSAQIRENQDTNSSYSMPEFPGYTGPACEPCHVIKVKAATHRAHPILQICIGPGEEHVSMAGIHTEVCILGMVERAMLERLLNVYAASAVAGSTWR